VASRLARLAKTGAICAIMMQPWGKVELRWVIGEVTIVMFVLIQAFGLQDGRRIDGER